MKPEEDPSDTLVAFQTVLDLEQKRCTWRKLNEAQLVSYLYKIYFILQLYGILLQL